MNMGPDKLEHYRQELTATKQRLNRVESEGVKALSRYDIEIASGGDAADAVQTAKLLLRNQIRYFSGKIEELERGPKQLGMFEERR